MDIVFYLFIYSPMSFEKKKIFPKLKKSLKNFLTDESGKITKKDALGLSLAIAAFSGIETVVAWHGSFPASVHGNNIYTSQNPATYDFYPTDASVTPNLWDQNSFTIINSATCNHASWIVNWHYSSTPSVNISSQKVDFAKSHSNVMSHASHGSHSSGGWC